MNAPLPALSVIIPAYNEQRYLPELLESLRPLHSDPYVEIIVVDNGSTDDTARVAAGSGVRVVSLARVPVGKARNEGARQARGEILAFLDADVVVMPEWIRAARDLAAELPAGSISGDTCDISAQPGWIEQIWFGAIYRRGAINYINSGNLVIRRYDFLSLGGFNESMTSGEDFDLCQRAVARGMLIRAQRDLHVRHMGFPRTIRQFIRREAWHGRSDFASLRSIWRSPVALAALIFAGLHLMAIAAVVVGHPHIAAACLAAIAVLCIASSAWKFRRETLTAMLRGVAVCWVYLAGRALAMFGPWTSSRYRS